VPESTVVLGRRKPRSVSTEDIAVGEDVLAAGAHHGSTFVEHQEFRNALLSVGVPAVSARDGLMAVVMGEAAERSAAEGRPVETSELLVEGC
jgi:predicted dehydrogenase